MPLFTSSYLNYDSMTNGGSNEKCPDRECLVTKYPFDEMSGNEMFSDEMSK